MATATTKSKSKTCKICGASAPLRAGFCEKCDGATPEQIAEIMRKKKNTENNKLWQKSLKLKAVYVPINSELDKAIEKRLAGKTEKSFSELALKALSKFLKVENPHEPVGRPKVENAEWD